MTTEQEIAEANRILCKQALGETLTEQEKVFIAYSPWGYGQSCTSRHRHQDEYDAEARN